MSWRGLLVLPVAAVIAALAIRSAAGSATPASPLHALQSSFPGHEEILANRLMTGVGSAARESKAPGAATMADLNALAVRAPLRAEPYLVSGAMAQVAGDGERSEQLLLAARARDPRSGAARYLLAERYLRTDRIELGLGEAAVLTGLEPRTAQPFIPAVAAYARNPGAAERVKRFFGRSPNIGAAVLYMLAEDPANAGLIVRLAPRIPAATRAPYPDWQGRIVERLVSTGQVASGERMWGLLSGREGKPTVVNPTFDPAAMPPPFDWTYASGSGGIAQAKQGQGLELIAYGREPIDLARQLLTLAPGRYRIAATLQGGGIGPGEALEWRVSCTDNKVIATLTLDRPGEFVVPAGCGGQILVLAGKTLERPETVQRVVRSVAIGKVG